MIVPRLPAWLKRSLRPSWLIGNAVAVCALMPASRCLADLPASLGADMPTARQPDQPSDQTLPDATGGRTPTDRLDDLAQIDILLRGIDRLLEDLRTDQPTRAIRVPSSQPDQIGIFHDLSGVIRDDSAWPVASADPIGENAAQPRGGGFDPVVLISSTAAGDDAAVGNTLLSARGPLLTDYRASAGVHGTPGSRIQGRTNVFARHRESQRRAGGNALGERYYLDWPWSMRVGHNMFYWVVGPPASIICISIALGAVGSSKRS